MKWHKSKTWACLLTSHDAGDLEALCKRVIIINHGQIVYEDKVSNLKRKFLTSKLVEVRYGEEVPKNIFKWKAPKY